MKFQKIIILFFFLSVLIIIQSCHHVETDIQYDQNPYADIVEVLNENIRSIQELVIRQMSDEKIAYIDSFNTDKVIMYFLNDNYPITLCCKEDVGFFRYPCIAVAPYGESLYWTLSGEFLTNAQGNKIEVSDRLMTPSLRYVGSQWYYVVGNYIKELPLSSLSLGFPSVSIMEKGYASIVFPSGYHLVIPTMDFKYPIVPNRAFYKDIFLDAGIGLTSRKSLYAADFLNMSLEGISFSRSVTIPEEKELQEKIVGGDVEDSNGRLLYPDGQPRYRVLFVNGGSSKTHGKSLSEKAINNMKDFVDNGGSYVGTCAGAFFASAGYDNIIKYPYYLGIWPAVTIHTGLSDGNTGMFIENNSPLLNYYDFGGDYYVENIRHNKGGYPAELPQYTEVLARYDYPRKEYLHLQPSIWAYKPSLNVGRVVLEGSHPEEVANGERRDLTAAMILYALDGIGTTPLKGFLQNGKERVMNKDTEDNNPAFSKIGDLQCHHFVMMIPVDAYNISVKINSDVDCDFALMMNHETFAFPDSAEYYVADGGPHQEIGFQTLEKGLWYIAVQCLTTVSVTNTDYGQEYYGRTDVLNGIPYKITVSWEEK